MTTTDLATRLETKAAAPAKQGATVLDLIDRQKAQIALALPKHLDADRLARIVTTEVRRTPRLMGCTPVSFLGALMQSAQLGLEPGPLGQCYFLPFRNKKAGTDEVQFIIGYRGYIDLARRSGQLVSIDAHVVYERDDFDFAYGLEPKLHHRPSLGGDRGQPVAAYAVAVLRDGGHSFVVLSVDEVEARRSRSRSGEFGPWVTDWDAMARKSAVRALAPYLPLSAEFMGAIDSDERVAEWRPSGDLVVDERDRLDEDDTWYEDEAKRRAELPAPSRYDTWTKQQLVDVCVERGLTTSGTKADLAARLIEHDAAAPAAVEIVEGSTAASSTGGGPVRGVDAGPPPGSSDGGEPTGPDSARSVSEPGDGVDAPAGMSAAASPPSDGSARSDFGEPLPPGPDTVSDDPAFWSTERWAAEVDRRGVNRNTVLRLARQLAEQAGIEPLPSEFGDWTAPAITVPLGEWLVSRGDVA